MTYHDSLPFSTFDRDPQPFITRCAMSYRGGWWYRNCHEANLNGLYDTHTHHQVHTHTQAYTPHRTTCQIHSDELYSIIHIIDQNKYLGSGFYSRLVFACSHHARLVSSGFLLKSKYMQIRSFGVHIIACSVWILIEGPTTVVHM